MKKIMQFCLLIAFLFTVTLYIVNCARSFLKEKQILSEETKMVVKEVAREQVQESPVYSEVKENAK